MIIRSVCYGLLALVALETVVAQVPQLPARLVNNPHVRWGHAGGNCELLVQRYYIICEDKTHRVPRWVTYRLGRENLRDNVQRESNPFHADRRLPRGERSEQSDYAHTGYDMGHMAPAGDFHRGARAMYETFLMSNMAPQRPNLNRVIWRRLEDQIRRIARDHGTIWVFTGPLYLNAAGNAAVAPDKFIGRNRVAVPTHYFKIVLCEHADHNQEMFAFIMPNQQAPFARPALDYLVSVDSVERLTGRNAAERLDFFAGLPDARENVLERGRATTWPLP